MTKSRTLARLLFAAGAAIMAMALFVPAAGATTPAPGYEEFFGCPDKAEITTCVSTEITGGNFKMGNKNVPIENKITISGGVNSGGENFQGVLTPVKQKVPGGVIGLTGLTWLFEFLGSEALTLYAVTEAAAQPQLFHDPIVLPIRVHLINGALGNNCYVGSFTEPIVLNLITGTTKPPKPNEPITGKSPEVSFDEKLEIVHTKNGELVDNSFAAPGANGCVLTLFGFIPISINGLVNSASALPAKAGTNETRQKYNLSLVESALVYP
ncbi:MAG TPA: hypothetical protein VLK89_00530 [Solirubrobacterales bacterium]|nr:hypothetical protein [Solirubrobacterales bacterium]